MSIHERMPGNHKIVRFTVRTLFSYWKEGLLVEKEKKWFRTQSVGAQRFSHQIVGNEFRVIRPRVYIRLFCSYGLLERDRTTGRLRLPINNELFSVSVRTRWKGTRVQRNLRRSYADPIGVLYCMGLRVVTPYDGDGLRNQRSPEHHPLVIVLYMIVAVVLWWNLCVTKCAITIVITIHVCMGNPKWNMNEALSGSQKSTRSDSFDVNIRIPHHEIPSFLISHDKGALDDQWTGCFCLNQRKYEIWNVFMKNDT